MVKGSIIPYDGAMDTTTTRPAPRWLDEDEKVLWRLYLATTRLVEDAIDRQLREDAGIPVSYYEILVRLSAQDDRSLRMGDLAEATLSSRSRLSHAMTKLEGLGWVERRSCPEDRRGQVAVLTDAGFEALRDAAPGHVEAVRRLLFDPLDRQQQQDLAAALRTVLTATGVDVDEIIRRPD